MVKRKTSSAAPASPAPRVQLRLRVTVGDTIAVGPGKVALLEAIRDTGSISAAAKALGMSYRRAWVLLKDLNDAMSSPAVASAQGGEQGGGSTLTPEGEAVIRLYRAIELKTMRTNAPQIEALLALLDTQADVPPDAA